MVHVLSSSNLSIMYRSLGGVQCGVDVTKGAIP